jgi:hypothetical protein
VKAASITPLAIQSPPRLLDDICLYGDDEGSTTIIEPGKRQVFRLPFREMLVVGDKDQPAGRDEIKSYCTINYKHENGRDEGLLRIVDSVNAMFFSLDQPGAQAAISLASRRKSEQQ